MLRFRGLAWALFILVLLGPIIDLSTGYFLSIAGLEGTYSSLVLSPGVLYRGIFLVPVFFLLIHFIRSPIRLFVYYLLLIFLAGSLLRTWSNLDVDFLRDTQRFVKLLLPILGFGAFQFIGQRFANNEGVRQYWKTIALYGGITALGLLSTVYLGLGLTVYRNVDFASAGLIDSQNSAGLILIITLPLALYYIYTYKNNNLLLALLVQAVWLFSAFRLSTRAALIGVPIGIISYQLFLLLSRKYTRNSLQILMWLFVAFLSIGVGFIVFRTWMNQDISFILYKFDLLAEGSFRNRVPLGIERIAGFTVKEHLFGIGDSGFATTENDVVDVYGKFGLLTLVPILLFLGYYYARLLVVFVRRKTLLTFTLVLSFTFYIAHAAFAGHALMSSPVNNIFLLILYLSFLESTRVAVPYLPTLRTQFNATVHGASVS